MSNKLISLSNFPAFNWSSEAIHSILEIAKQKQANLLNTINVLSTKLKLEANEEIVKNELKTIIFDQKTPEFDQKWQNFNKNHKNLLTLEDFIHLNANFGEMPPKNVDQFLVWYNKPGLDRLLKAAIAHLWFISIVPFENENIHIACLITNRQLAKADGIDLRYYSLGTQLFYEKQEYHFILKQVLNGSLDITIWLQWFLGCLIRTYENASIILKHVISKHQFFEKHKNLAFNNRQSIIINKLLNGYQDKLSTTIYAGINNCSRDTALRDITYLLNNSILKKEYGLGKNTNYVLMH